MPLRLDNEEILRSTGREPDSLARWQKWNGRIPGLAKMSRREAAASTASTAQLLARIPPSARSLHTPEFPCLNAVDLFLPETRAIFYPLRSRKSGGSGLTDAMRLKSPSAFSTPKSG